MNPWLSPDIDDYLRGMVFTADIIPVEVPAQDESSSSIVVPDGTVLPTDGKLVEARIGMAYLSVENAQRCPHHLAIMFPHAGYVVAGFSGRLRLVRYQEILAFRSCDIYQSTSLQRPPSPARSR